MSYNAEKMWDSPRPPFGAFRGRTGETYPPRGPHGAEPRMRGRGPLPFRGGAMPSGPPYTSQGGHPHGYRDVGRDQEGAWESRPAPKEQMSIPRRPGPPANFRDAADMHYSEKGLAPDMDYRDREGMEQRKWTTPDVDYRAEENVIGYRVRLPPPARRPMAERDLQERDGLELDHRKRLATAIDYRQREAAEMEYKLQQDVVKKRREMEELLLRERDYTDRLFREKDVPDHVRDREPLGLRDREGMPLGIQGYRDREGAALGYRDREGAALGYRDREGAALGYRDREGAALGYRDREGAALGYRDREGAALGYRDREDVALGYRDREDVALGYREGAALGVRDREAAALAYRERKVVDYTERGLPTPVRESDLDLRVKESVKGTDFMGRDRRMEYQENLSREYSESGAVSLPYREQEKTDMEVENQKNDNLNSATVKDTAAFTSMDQKAAEMPYRQGETSQVDYKKEFQAHRTGFQKHVDADYRGKECTDSDYRGKESSDSDYRGRGNADIKYPETKTTSSVSYQKTKTADSDYREKESTDSDYREREHTDTDYRQSAEDYMKESTKKMEAGRDFLSSSLKKDNKGLAQAKLTTDYPLIPTEMEEKTGPKKVEIIPFLAFSEEELSSLTNVMVEAQTTSPAQAQAPSGSEPSCPGKLDTDFRGRPNPEDLNIRERAEKAAGFTAHSTPEELRPGDQDLRSKDSFAKEPKKVEADQDLRTSGHIQKDEDLRGGETKAPEEFFTQNSLLMDFLRLAAKELREKTTVSEAKDEPTALTPAIADSSAAKSSFHPDLIARPARPMVPGSSMAPEIELLCREDTDYRNMDFNDVDLRVGHRPDKRLAEKRPREEPQPGSKDKDYRRTPLPEGATKVIWLDGLPTGASREEILCALGSAQTLPEEGVNLIGYIPGYSTGSVCVEFSLVEEAVGCMEANKGVLHFRGKKVSLKYIPNSDRWSCLQCKAVNVLSKERCWQCSALRAGTDHLSLAHKEPKTPPVLSTPRSKKRKSKHSPSGRSPDRCKEKTPPRERSPPPKTSKLAKQADSDSATVIIRGICAASSPESVVKALQPFAQLSPSNVRIMKNRKNNQRGFGFIDLKSHKEAIRLTVLVRDVKPRLIIDGNPVTVDLAVGQRRNEGKSHKGNKSSPGKNRKQRGQKRPYNYPGHRGNDDEGPSYIYDPNTGCYVDPLTDSYYNEAKAELKDDRSFRDPERGPKEKQRHTKRGFTEEEEEEEEETVDAFKKPLPPPVVMKEEPPEPKVNPLLGLLGAYVEDSEEEDEKEEEISPLFLKKPAPLPPAPAPTPAVKFSPLPAPKPVVTFAPLPAPKPVVKPAPLPAPKPMLKPEPKPTTSSNSEYDKLLDWRKMVCLLCRRQFPNKDTLMKHKSLSELHKQNLALHEKMKKSQKKLEYLQQREQEENQFIQRRLQQAKKELEMLEREEEGARQQEAGESLDTELREKRKSKGTDTRSESSSDKKRPKSSASPRPTGESYRDNMKRLILERYKELE